MDPYRMSSAPMIVPRALTAVELTGYSCDCIRDTQAAYCTDCLCTMIEIETDSGRLVGQA